MEITPPEEGFPKHMTIYFTASIVGKKHYLQNYKKLITLLQSKGHEVISNHIINTSENDINKEAKEDLIEFQHELEKWIQSADCMMVETSYPSISVGYEISLAYNLGKPVLLLYGKDASPPSLLAHHKDEKIVCEQYTEKTLTAIVDDFLSYVKGSSDLRFTFFITSKIASYLDTISKKLNLPKSVYLRNLIEEDMKKRS